MTGTLNMEVIDELLALSEDGDPELLVDLIQMYLADVPIKLDAIVRGIEAKDWERVERAAHSLKGSAGSLGAVHVQAECDRIQNACRQHQPEAIAQQSAALTQHIKDADSALRAVLDRYR
jgi:HPt (histidine-containing phosphotransfer) domain-containing protein